MSGPQVHVQQRRGPRGPMMRGGPPGMMPGAKAKDFKGSLKKLISYMKPFNLKIIIIALLAAVSAVFMIAGPKILIRATDELTSGVIGMITGADVEINFNYIGSVLLFLLGLYLISSCFSYIQGYMMSGVSTSVAFNLRNDIIKKINKIPLDYYHRNSQGDIISRITNDVDTLGQNLNQSITQLITSATTIVGVTIMMFTISPLLTFVTMCILPVSAGLSLFIIKKSQKYFRGQQEYLGAVNGHIEEMYGGHLVIKAFNGEKKSIEAFDSQNEKLFDSNWKAQFLSGLMMPLMGFIGNIGYVLICIIGASIAASGKMTIGGILAFIQYVRNFTQPVVQLATISNQFQSAIAAAERVFEFLEEAEEVTGEILFSTKHDSEKSGVALNGEIVFKNVRFGYDKEKTVIKDFSAHVKAGMKVAIVGPTGAGKTTMVKLLMRFYELNEGAILIDGYDMKNFTREDIRREFGMVLQDTWLFNGSIKENVRYGRLGATDDEIFAAAEAAQADYFIHTLPDSYEMELNEEATNMSQGQKQLLTIARAMLKDYKVLILDEATSSVDTRTEILIQKAMDNLMHGRTSFIIAHRLSTIRNADLILCMNEGDIVEQGTHAELMAKNGFYANLYNSQFDKVS